MYLSGWPNKYRLAVLSFNSKIEGTGKIRNMLCIRLLEVTFIKNFHLKTYAKQNACFGLICLTTHLCSHVPL